MKQTYLKNDDVIITPGSSFYNSIQKCLPCIQKCFPCIIGYKNRAIIEYHSTSIKRYNIKDKYVLKNDKNIVLLRNESFKRKSKNGKKKATGFIIIWQKTWDFILVKSTPDQRRLILYICRMLLVISYKFRMIICVNSKPNFLILIIEKCRSLIPIVKKCRSLIPIVKKCRDLILVVKKCRDLILVVEKCRALIPIAKKCRDLILVTIRNCYLSRLFRKEYSNICYYWHYYPVFIRKKVMVFSHNKTAKDIHYQANITEMDFDIIENLLNHIKQYTLARSELFVTLIAYQYLYTYKKQTPIRKVLAVHVLDEKSKYYKRKNEILDFFERNFLMYAHTNLTDKYKDDFTKNHLSWRFRFRKPPVSTELLHLEPFEYFEFFVNGDFSEEEDDTKDEKENMIERLSSQNENENDSGYNNTDFDF